MKQKTWIKFAIDWIKLFLSSNQDMEQDEWDKDIF
jgi:hypothetical protein